MWQRIVVKPEQIVPTLLGVHVDLARGICIKEQRCRASTTYAFTNFLGIMQVLIRLALQRSLVHSF